jgi:hypothetical protein
VGGFFSSISGQIGKSFLVAALLPSGIFVLFSYLYVLPMAPLGFGATALLQLLDPQWQLGAGVGLATIVATLLYVLNNSLLRLYEGYPWQYGAIGEALKRWHRRQLAEAATAVNQIDALDLDALPAGQRDALDATAGILLRRQRDEYPRPTSVLPTAFGNRLRSFENYPYRQYRLSAISLWPHFVAELDKEQAAAVDDAKMPVDLLVNLSALAYLSFALLLLLGVWFPGPNSTPALLWWLARTLLAFCAGFIFYRCALQAAGGWGLAVKSTFDLRRAAVLKRFGFDMPEDLEVERAVWEAISFQLIYGDTPSGKARLHFRGGGAFLMPFDPDVTIARGILVAGSPPALAGVQTVRLLVRNGGSTPIDTLAVIDGLAARQFVIGSASIDGRPASPTGVTQLAFAIEKLAPGASVTITYDSWAHAK